MYVNPGTRPSPPPSAPPPDCNVNFFYFFFKNFEKVKAWDWAIIVCLKFVTVVKICIVLANFKQSGN